MLTKNVGKNIKELIADNKKTGKAKGANGKVRSMAQIKAIALSAAGKSKKDKFQVPVKKKGKVVGYATKSGAKNVQKLLDKKK
jgi:hypothetical protein